MRLLRPCNMNTFLHVPPGFRFYPTDEELVGYYLTKKVASKRIDLNVIKDVDLYKIEPWDLQECCRIEAEEQTEWHFFSHKDKKYPTGTRTNRATRTGFWKATGRDKPIYSKCSLIGLRKTLVYYIGRAPNGQKTDWIMHEYRLESNENGTSQQEEGWVVCKVFKKRVTTTRKASEAESSHWLDEKLSLMPDLDSPNQEYCSPDDSFHQQLPHLQGFKLPNYSNIGSPLQLPNFQSQLQIIPVCSSTDSDRSAGQVMDWRILDKFVASQLSHDDNISKEPNYENATQVPGKKEASVECESPSNSSCQIELWM